MSDVIAVGGVGGSGTRVVAAVLQEAGFHVGEDLNPALDNLWFTLLFKTEDILSLDEDSFAERVAIFSDAMSGKGPPEGKHADLVRELARADRPGRRPPRSLAQRALALVKTPTGSEKTQHPAAWLAERARTLLAATRVDPPRTAWAWKEPNTHMVIDRLVHHMPGLRYVHVARNGLDMAFSRNQFQLRFWGGHAFGDIPAPDPDNSLRFWRWSHERIFHLAEAFEDRFLFVRFEDICRNPEPEVERLLTFCGLSPDADLLRRCSALVSTPPSVGRHSQHPRAIFRDDDIAYVRDLGFEVSYPDRV